MWRGVTADNFPVVLIFQKQTYIKSSNCYVTICCLFWNLEHYNYHCICASSLVHSEIWGKITFYHFSEKCLFSVFLHNIIEAQLSLKNAWLPPIFFLDFNSLWYDLLVSHTTVVIIWEKILPISGHHPQTHDKFNKLVYFLMKILLVVLGSLAWLAWSEKSQLVFSSLFLNSLTPFFLVSWTERLLLS